MYPNLRLCEHVPRSNLERGGSSSPGEEHFKYSKICCLSTPVSARESPSLEASPSPVIMEHDETEEDETPVNM